MAKSSQNTGVSVFMGAFCGFFSAALIGLVLAFVLIALPPASAANSSGGALAVSQGANLSGSAAEAVSALPLPPASAANSSGGALAVSQGANLSGSANKSPAAQPQKAAAGAKAEPGMFDFDPFVLVSQVINFFLLLIILNHFIFKPLDAAVEKRRQELEQIKKDAENDYKDASALKSSYEKRIASINDEAYELRQKALAEADEKVKEIISEAHKRADEIVEQGEMNIFLERQSAWAGLREEVAELTMMASEKVIEASLNDEMHRELIQKAIDKLEGSIEAKK